MTALMVTVGILSIGDMGLGIAKLLKAHNYNVVTTTAGRSKATIARAESASINILPSHDALVRRCHYILSIVPPRDAHATASKVAEACHSKANFLERQKHRASPESPEPLAYIDLNAISPKFARGIAALFDSSSSANCDEGIPIHFIDGGIIGAPPAKVADSSWRKPSLVVSGPHNLSAGTPSSSGPRLTEILNMKHIAPTIGPASGLKMCFASTTKGLAAIATQSVTTAQTLGVLPELQEHLKQYSPATAGLVEKGVTGMPPKAYRWVDEMKQIGETFSEDGGFGPNNMFEAVAEVYRIIADETELGNEKVGDRKRGTTVEDVAVCVGEGLRGKGKAKVE